MAITSHIAWLVTSTTATLARIISFLMNMGSVLLQDVILVAKHATHQPPIALVALKDITLVLAHVLHVTLYVSIVLVWRIVSNVFLSIYWQLVLVKIVRILRITTILLILLASRVRHIVRLVYGILVVCLAILCLSWCLNTNFTIVGRSVEMVML